MPEKNFISKKSKQLRFRVFMMMFSLAISITSFAYVTYSWFTFTRQQIIRNNNVAVDLPYKYSASVKVDDILIENKEMNFVNFFPGDVHVRKLTLEISNNDTQDFKVNWFFKFPSLEQEVPFIDTEGDYGINDYYYYFGSQIQLKQMSTTIGLNTTNGGINQGNYLVPSSPGDLNKGQVNGVENPISVSDHFFIIKDLVLAPTQTASTVVFFAFVDNGTNQNVFQNEQFTSERELYLLLNPGN